jgi:SMI1 / KNR4 family (SUKH-1)
MDELAERRAFDSWKRRCETAVHACTKIGGSSAELRIERPASEAEVCAVEKALGITLPASFRRALLRFSRALEINWFLPDNMKPALPLQIFCGMLSWDLHKLVELNRELQSWVDNVFPDPGNKYDRVWHDKLAFHNVGNGDYLAFERGAPDSPVVYLSHDDGQGHGYLLGPTFFDAIDRLTIVGCAGAEDWQWLPFTSSPTSGLEPDGDNARKWRDWFGLP